MPVSIQWMTVLFIHCTMVFRSSRLFLEMTSQLLEALCNFDWQVSCTQAVYLLILELYILAKTARRFPITEISFWHMDFMKWSTYISIISSVLLTLTLIDVAVYRLIDIAAFRLDLLALLITDLLALQPVSVIAFWETLMGFMQFHLQPWHHIFTSLGYL